MTLATPGDLRTSMMKDLTETQAEFAPALLERAELLVRVRIPDLDARAEADPLVFAPLVRLVEAEAVARVLRNPDAYRQESEGSYSYSLNYEVASGLLDILDREWERLGVDLQGWGSIAPGTDGYAASRLRWEPSLQFQLGWPGRSSFSHGGEFSL